MKTIITLLCVAICSTVLLAAYTVGASLTPFTPNGGGPYTASGSLPVQLQGGGVQGSGTFTLSSTANAYLSSGGTAATSVPCNWVTLSISTTTAYISTSGTAALSVPSGLAPLTISASNLNTLQVSGSGARIGYIYGL